MSMKIEWSLVVGCLVLLGSIGETAVPELELSKFVTRLGAFNETDLIAFHGLIAKRVAAAVRDATPLELGGISVLVRDENTYINVTLSKVKIEGLDSLRVLDVATSTQHLRASVLLRAAQMKLSSTFKMKAFLSNSFNSSTIYDAGTFEVDIDRPAISWFARLVGESNEQLAVTQSGVRTHMSEVDFAFTTSSKHDLSPEIMETLGMALVDESRLRLERALSHSINKAMRRAQPDVTRILEELLLEDDVPQTFGVGSHCRGKCDLMEKARIQSEKLAQRYDNSSDYDDNAAASVGAHQLQHHHRSRRQVPCNNGTELDDYVDYLFRFARRLIRVMEPIPGPNLTVCIEDSIQVFLHDLEVRGVHTLSREKPAYVKCNKQGDVTVGLVVKIEKITGTAKYRVIHDYRHLLFQGDADFKLKNTVVWVQISQLGNGNNRLDVFRIWKLGKMHIRLRGLGGVTSALSMLMSRVINDDPWNVIPIAEAQMITFGREMIANVTVPIFSLV
ncbi:uncharacterized protein LOC100904548 [Galendromus occidentalis]|uniref:Uncharacterized protein LOC100904548 n=1 Tax=Galendromus occidentalis TaxID=34638 RepID=A0AAJ6QQH1_9ACAR|nr:uncharacterized protein LOC100904548 [Galendromus occidentalis]